MPNAHDVLFRTLADPTRRAIFERLCREGEQTVGALTARSGVSQPAVSKHLGVLKQAGLVRDRHEGRQTHYSAQLARPGAADRLDKPDGRLLAKPVRPPRRSAQKDGPMNQPAAETRSVVVEREIPFPPEKIWRALTQPHLIEEWLMKNDFKPVMDHRFNLRADWGVGRLPGRWRSSRTRRCPTPGAPWVWRAWSPGRSRRRAAGTHLRMEQSGFRPDQQQAYHGAKDGWQKFLAPSWSRSWRGAIDAGAVALRYNGGANGSIPDEFEA